MLYAWNKKQKKAKKLQPVTYNMLVPATSQSLYFLEQKSELESCPCGKVLYMRYMNIYIYIDEDSTVHSRSRTKRTRIPVPSAMF